MHYRIVSDIPGRLRLRCGQYLFSDEEARGVAHALMAIKGVYSAEVHTANGSILVTGSPAARNAVLATVDNLNTLRLPRKADEGELSMAIADNRQSCCASPTLQTISPTTHQACVDRVSRSTSHLGGSATTGKR